MHEPSSPVELSLETAPKPSSLQTVDGAITDSAFALWPLSLRIAFRLCFVYFGLFCLTTQIFTGMLSTPWTVVPELYTLSPLRQIIEWTAVHVLHTHKTLVFTGSGSGDKTTDWILILLIAAVAIIATAIWSALDRKRTQYSKLHAYFRLFVRFALASQLISYGLAKAFPGQMPYPGLTRLLEPFGNFSEMGVLWASIGASPAYEIFAGCAELGAGIFLLFPRTTLLGALIAVLDMIQVFTLNMTYDVPVKILSFHLLLLAVFLTAPELPRLFKLLFGNSSIPAPAPSPIFRSRRSARLALAVQVVYGTVVLLGLGVHDAWNGWHQYGPPAPKPPLYGIWDVEEYSVDGQVRQPLITDKDRWHLMISDYPGYLVFQMMDNSLSGYRAEFDAAEQTVALTKQNRKDWEANLAFRQPAQDQLDLDGDFDSHKVHVHRDGLMSPRNSHCSKRSFTG
jgi:uncharacterized membrane protein YphA (DoxX/SURF4 family)